MRRILPPLVVGILALAGWELTVKAGRIAPFILPAPSAIWAELVEQRGNVLDAALASGANALVGLIGGAVTAVLAAMLTSRARLLSEVSVPFAAVLNAVVQHLAQETEVGESAREAAEADSAPPAPPEPS